MRILFCLILISSGLPAFSRTVTTLKEADFNTATADPAKMDANKLYVTQKLVEFGDWNRQAPVEAQAMNLYPGFIEPQVRKIKYGVEETITEKMVLFVFRSKMILNRPPGQIDLANLLKLDVIRQFDKQLQVQPLAPKQIMPLLVSAREQQIQANPKLDGQIHLANFQWCKTNVIADTLTTPFGKPDREQELGYLMPKGRAPWCSDKQRSICTEACLPLPAGYIVLVAAANQVVGVEEKKDYAIGFQSELRYFTSDQEAALPVSLQKLTGVNTAVRGGIEQNGFYYNQVFEYTKILGVLQDHPTDPNKTIATTLSVVAVKKRTWDQFEELRSTLKGESPRMNTATGITSGVPNFTKSTINAIGTILETGGTALQN